MKNQNEKTLCKTISNSSLNYSHNWPLSKLMYQSDWKSIDKINLIYFQMERKSVNELKEWNTSEQSLIIYTQLT